jgi:hypothetical protein
MRDPRSMPRPVPDAQSSMNVPLRSPAEGSRREQRLRAHSCVWTFHTNNRQNVVGPRPPDELEQSKV